MTTTPASGISDAASGDACGPGSAARARVDAASIARYAVLVTAARAGDGAAVARAPAITAVVRPANAASSHPAATRRGAETLPSVTRPTAHRRAPTAGYPTVSTGSAPGADATAGTSISSSTMRELSA